MNQKGDDVAVINERINERRKMILSVQFSSIQMILDAVINGEERVLNNCCCVFQSDAIAIVDEAGAFKGRCFSHFLLNLLGS